MSKSNVYFLRLALVTFLFGLVACGLTYFFSAFGETTPPILQTVTILIAGYGFCAVFNDVVLDEIPEDNSPSEFSDTLDIWVDKKPERR